jgi:hypothetical protein
MSAIRSKAFSAGFFSGLVLFVAANIYGYDRMNEIECFDCIVGFGLPFRLYETGGFFTVTRVLWHGFAADVLIAIGVSLMIGLLCSRLFGTKKVSA